MTLPNLIVKAIEEVDENLSYVDLADAVAEVLESNYGTHNYQGFLNRLKSQLDNRI
jgi:hypothetical protein